MQSDANASHQRIQLGNAQQQKPPVAQDSLQKITAFMAKHQIAGLPRNFELVYEAMVSRNAELARDLVALGTQPSQIALDHLGLKHRLVSHCGLADEHVQCEATAALKRLAEQVSLGLMRKQTFTRGLETIVKSIREDETRGLSEIMEELEFLDSAARDLIRDEAEIEQKLKAGLAQIEAAERTAEAARAMVLTDRLTELPNRIAFMNRLEDLYDRDSAPFGTAMLLVDIDNFKEINRQFGDEAGNKLLKRLAAVFRKTIKKHDFVARIEGDDFAFLFSDVGATEAQAIAERLRAAVENNLIFATEQGRSQGSLGLSIGFAMTADAATPSELIAHAESALATARTIPRHPVAGYGCERQRSMGRNVA